MDDAQTAKLQELLDRLGRAIHAELKDSDEVNECLARLRVRGWDAVLLLDASELEHGSGQQASQDGRLRIDVDTRPSAVAYRIDRDDARWLSDLGISPSRHRSHPRKPLPPLRPMLPPGAED